MKNSELDKNKFISSIIVSIKMNPIHFMKNLAIGEKYEITINEWSINLFNEGKALEEAIKIINKRIGLVLASTAKPSPDPLHSVLIKNHQKIMSLLDKNALYSSLSNDEKNRIQDRIDAFVEGNLYTPQDVVDIIINVIQNTMDKKKSKRLNSKAPSRNDNNPPYISKMNKLLKSKIFNENVMQRSTTMFG